MPLAFLFGYVIPMVDMKMRNTFLGATHLPLGAIASLCILLLVVNPLLRMVANALTKRGVFFVGTLMLAEAAETLFWRGLPSNGLSCEFFIFGDFRSPHGRL